ncbi:MAG: hypothetical protein CBB66_00385 [bacterium TMED6]|nr:MAG: hypothetical protein CBB66_00385 [bacterium TMED6]
MKYKFFILTILLSFFIAQDRSTLFATGDGDPDTSLGGHSIQLTENEVLGASDRFFLSNEYMLERVYVYLSYEPEFMFDTQSIEVQIAEDDNGKPGIPVSSNILELDYDNFEGKWYSFLLLENCLKTEPSSFYWLTVLPMEGTNAKWIYSEESSFIFSTTADGGETWEDYSIGQAGSAAVTGEQIYIPPFDGGDVNGDFIVNILDAVQLVQYVLGNISFDDDQIDAGDLNQDGGINILDVVAMMNIILFNGNDLVTEFLYEDLNVSSPSFGQLVGPPIYQGMITGYYFGKAG